VRLLDRNVVVIIYIKFNTFLGYHIQLKYKFHIGVFAFATSIIAVTSDALAEPPASKELFGSLFVR